MAPRHAMKLMPSVCDNITHRAWRLRFSCLTAVPALFASTLISESGGSTDYSEADSVENRKEFVKVLTRGLSDSVEVVRQRAVDCLTAVVHLDLKHVQSESGKKSWVLKHTMDEIKAMLSKESHGDRMTGISLYEGISWISSLHSSQSFLNQILTSNELNTLLCRVGEDRVVNVRIRLAQVISPMLSVQTALLRPAVTPPSLTPCLEEIHSSLARDSDVDVRFFASSHTIERQSHSSHNKEPQERLSLYIPQKRMSSYVEPVVEPVDDDDDAAQIHENTLKHTDTPRRTSGFDEGALERLNISEPRDDETMSGV
mmetsp:Transcript_51626/g.70353  ORF Transcript_51626/g.70353 Transcript_51626/m.70353 type:complete len:314 (+) Transcript_51626:258-1199(+)